MELSQASSPPRGQPTYPKAHSTWTAHRVPLTLISAFGVTGAGIRYASSKRVDAAAETHVLSLPSTRPFSQTAYEVLDRYNRNTTRQRCFILRPRIANVVTATLSVGPYPTAALLRDEVDKHSAEFKQFEKIKKLDISIGMMGLTGTIEIPDISINIGDFIFFEGDFKLTLGDKFTADAYTGIDPMLGGALDSLLDLATQKLGEAIVGSDLPDLGNVNAVQRLLGVSQDFTTMYGVSYMGVSFAASNVNAFIGGGGRPDFSRPLADQGLIGFGLQNLDLGFGIYNPKLPGIWGMLFKDTVKPIATLKASVDELGAYGFGDFLKILGRRFRRFDPSANRRCRERHLGR
jgi:hypothetical protein